MGRHAAAGIQPLAQPRAPRDQRATAPRGPTRTAARVPARAIGPARDAAMVIIYRAANITDAHLVRHLLEAEGIAAFVQGEYLQGAVGELPAASSGVTVGVAPAQAEAARALVLAWEVSEPVDFDQDEAFADLSGQMHAGEAAPLDTAEDPRPAPRRMSMMVLAVVSGFVLWWLWRDAQA